MQILLFVYRFCNGNPTAAAAEYRRRFPQQKHPNKNVFFRVLANLRETGCLIK